MALIPVRWTVPVLSGLLPLLVAGGVLAAAYREVRQSALDSAERELTGALTTLTSRFATDFRNAERRVHGLASEPAVAAYVLNPTPATRAAALLVLSPLQPSAGTNLLLEILGPSGERLFPGVPADSLPPLPGRDELMSLVGGADSAGIGAQRWWGDILLFPIVALIVQDDTPIGHLVSWQRAGTGSGVVGIVADLVGEDAGFLIGSTGGAWSIDGAAVPEPAFEPGAEGGLQRYRRLGEGVRLAAVEPVPGSPWVLALDLPESTVLAASRRFLARLSGLVVVLGGLGLLAGLIISRQITRPLVQLTTAAEAMASGAHQVRVSTLGNDEPGRLAAAFNRMAERVDAEVHARDEAETQWRLLFRHNPHPMWVFDAATLQFLAVNDLAVERYGYTREEFLAMTIEAIRPPGEVAALHAWMAEGGPARDTPGQFRHRRKDGSVLDVEVRSQPVQFGGRPARLVLAQDVTERLALEAALRQSQKMEAVGRLAGGIAHDFNNLLAVIMTYTELVREEMPAGDPRVADLEEVTGAAEKARALTRQLLAFSRQQVLQPAILDPNQAIRSVEQLLRRLLGEDIIVALHLDPGISPIRIDPGQFEQVLMNLAVNARDAMPEGGTLAIITAVADLDEASCPLHGLAAPGRFAVISVSDTGTGMTPEVKSRMFEPFFTTKEIGKGTGLGLATVYGIVTQAGGNVTVYSEPGMGATFRVYLPAVEPGSVVAAPVTAEEEAPVGTEAILLVEDDASVRAAATAVLERLGYRVLAASGAEDARILMQGSGGEVRLVISDVVMPTTDGPTLIRSLRQEFPQLRALLMSGYAGEVIARRGVLETGVMFLEKPFTAKVLARKVREALDRPAEEA